MIMKRTAQEFRNNAIKYRIDKWMFRECSICGHHIGFLFFRGNSEVYFDGACDCACGDLRPQTWEYVAEIYNLQKNPDVIREFDEFWHFE